MDMKRPIVLIVIALVAAACGDGGAATTKTAATTSPSDTPPSEGSRTELLDVSDGVTRSTPDPSAPIADLVGGFNDAGFGLWKTQALEDNFIFSPISIGHALLMARAAADDATGAAIDAAFGLPSGVAAHQAWNALDQAIASSADAQDEISLSVADRIWPRLDLQPAQDWVDLLAAEHGSSVETLDLVGDPEGSRQIINDWVSDQTEGLIPDLLPEGFITAETLLILTDAIYFEAQWQTVFGKYGPESGPFTRLDGSTVDIEFMQELELGDRRGTGHGYLGAEIPYAGGEFSMLVVVPDEGRFDEVRGRLGQDLLDEIDAEFTTGPYELLMPKWENTTNLDLIPWLKDLGAAPGNYPEIAPGAFLGGAVHGADIAVDENGTVAAAATGLGFLESGPSEPELTVRADHPFFYVIRHRPTGAVLFAGQVTDPTA